MYVGEIGGLVESMQIEEIKSPSYLYKILSLDDWGKSGETVHLSSMDTDFIHFATEDQLYRIVEKFWAGEPSYVVLKIETAKLPGDLVFEANPGGTSKYYHLYDGAIPMSSVVESKINNT